MSAFTLTAFKYLTRHFIRSESRQALQGVPPSRQQVVPSSWRKRNWMPNDMPKIAKKNVFHTGIRKIFRPPNYKNLSSRDAAGRFHLARNHRPTFNYLATGSCQAAARLRSKTWTWALDLSLSFSQYSKMSTIHHDSVYTPAYFRWFAFAINTAVQACSCGADLEWESKRIEPIGVLGSHIHFLASPLLPTLTQISAWNSPASHFCAPPASKGGFGTLGAKMRSVERWKVMNHDKTWWWLAVIDQMWQLGIPPSPLDTEDSGILELPPSSMAPSKCWVGSCKILRRSRKPKKWM